MKQLFIALLMCAALAASAFSTDIVVGAHQVPGYSPSNLGQPLTLSVTVSNGVNIVSSAAGFRSQWVGLTGMRVSIAGSFYYVSNVNSTSIITLTETYVGSSGTVSMVVYPYVEARLYSSISFYPNGSNNPVLPGAPNGGPAFRRYAASVINNGGIDTLYLPEMVIPATTNGTPSNQARISLFFHRPDGALVGGAAQSYTCNNVSQFRIPTTTPTSWKDICTYNSAPVVQLPETYITTSALNALLPSCSANQIIYFAATGRAQSCANIGTGLSWAGNTLTATAASPQDRNTYIYASDYGTVCNGSTDDTGAINTALGAANAAKKRLVLPAGVCRVTQVVLSDYDQLVGAGIGKTILYSADNQAIVSVNATAFHAQISDLTIRGTITAGSSQVGLNLGGSGYYWQFLAERLRIEDTGAAGYKNTRAFSSSIKDVFIDNTAGFAVDYDAASPANRHINLYVGGIRSTAPVAFRIRGGTFYCENCNGINGCPASGTCTYARIGKKSGTDGDVTSGNATAYWTHSNAESWKTIAFEHLYGSRSYFKDETTIVGDFGVTGKIGIKYEVDSTYPQRSVKGYADDTVLVGDPLSQYSQSQLIHANGLPPLQVMGQGINGGGTGNGVKINTYYNTVTTRSEPLTRADGNVKRVTVTGDYTFTEPGVRYIEANCGAPCTITLPWPGWYNAAQETITVKDISGNASANPVVVVAGGGASINNTTNYDIRRNYGALILLPFESDTVTDVDWRVINEFAGGTAPTMTMGGSANLDFFPRWETTTGRLSLSSAIFQSGSDVALNGGNLVFVRGGNTLTIAPHASTGSYTLRFPSGAPAGDRCLRMTSAGQIETTGADCGSGGGGGSVTSVALATGDTGTDVNISGSPITGSGTITVNIPDASLTARGLITTGTQPIAGAKTFGSTLTTTQINPSTDNMYSLGTSALRWAEVNVGPGSLYIRNDATNTSYMKLMFSSTNAQIITDAATPLRLLPGGGTNGVSLSTAGVLTAVGTGGISGAAITTGSVGVTTGGTGLTSWATNGVPVATATNTVAISVIPSCSNATTSKLLYNSSTQAFTCGTDQTGAGGTGITTLNGLTTDPQTFANDTNVTIVSSGSTHTLTWSGTLAVSRGGSGAGTLTGILLGNGTSAFTALTTSAGIAGALSDETGSGALVFGTAPTITGGSITAVTTLSTLNAGTGTFSLRFLASETLTANRTLTVQVQDANRTLSLGGNFFTASSFTTAGANALTLTTTGGTNVTLPTTGTLATLAGNEAFSNKTLTSPVLNVGSDATGDLYYRNAGVLTRLAIGSSSQCLVVTGGLPVWGSCAAGSAPTASFKTANYTTVAADRHVMGDATGGNFTVTFIAASSASGTYTTVCKYDTSANTVTATAGSSSDVLSSAGQCTSYASNGTTWYHYNP